LIFVDFHEYFLVLNSTGGFLAIPAESDSRNDWRF